MCEKIDVISFIEIVKRKIQQFVHTLMIFRIIFNFKACKGIVFVLSDVGDIIPNIHIDFVKKELIFIQIDYDFRFLYLKGGKRSGFLKFICFIFVSVSFFRKH